MTPPWSRDHRRRLAVLLAMGAVLLLASISTFGMLVTRLSEARSSVREDALWATYQLDKEVNRLYGAVHYAARDDDDDGLKAASEAYDIVFSRLGVLEEGSLPAMFVGSPRFNSSVRRVATEIRLMEPLFSKLTSGGSAPLRLRELAPRLSELRVETSEIAAFVQNHNALMRMHQREVTSRLYWTLASAVAAFALVMLGIIVALIQQLREADASRRRLEAMAKDLAETAAAAEAGSRAKSEFLSTMERMATGFDSSVKLGASELESSARNASVEAETMVLVAKDALVQARIVSATAESTSASVSLVAERSEQLLVSMKETLERAKSATRMADHVSEYSESSTGVMTSLHEAASRIGSVVELIGSIASQTNLLALNATIEAARAGERGRGFAIVAGEVKALAAQTAHSTATIAGYVKAIQASSLEAVDTMQSIHSILRDLKEIVSLFERSMIEQSSNATDIASSTQQTAANTSKVSWAVLRIADQSEQIRCSTEGVRNTTQKLLQDAQMLAINSERFLENVKAVPLPTEDISASKVNENEDAVRPLAIAKTGI